jgi:hypothetical protein
MIFNSRQYSELHSLVFRPDYPDYPGYKPDVVESPNGDGVRDSGKRFGHIAMKYLHQAEVFTDATATMMEYLRVAHGRAYSIAVQLGVPREFMPSFEHGCLRVLEYPVGTNSAIHTDFDLFTINCYRNQYNAGLGDDEVHMGEIGELIGMGPALRHHVVPSARVQHSIVYFAEPSHDAVLPSGVTVGEWLADRVKRSRYEV